MFTINLTKIRYSHGMTTISTILKSDTIALGKRVKSPSHLRVFVWFEIKFEIESGLSWKEKKNEWKKTDEHIRAQSGKTKQIHWCESGILFCIRFASKLMVLSLAHFFCSSSTLSSTAKIERNIHVKKQNERDQIGGWGSGVRGSEGDSR